MKRTWLLFPYGQAAGVLLLLSLTTGLGLLWLERGQHRPEADLVFALFAQNHYEAYLKVVPEFERQHQVKVQLQLVPARGLQSRLQSAFLVDAEVPDVVEILNGSMGYFTQGPIEDVGFVDLTDWLHAEGISPHGSVAVQPFGSSRGRIFGMPHDVHPVTRPTAPTWSRASSGSTSAISTPGQVRGGRAAVDRGSRRRRGGRPIHDRSADRRRLRAGDPDVAARRRLFDAKAT